MTLQVAGIKAPVAQLNKAIRQTTSSVGKLSSGSRLLNASDDVASLSVATNMTTRIFSLRTALLNTAQASSMLQVADGGLQQMQGMLDRMMALSVEANSGSVSDQDRAFLDIELQNLRQEVSHTAQQTRFGNVALLTAAEEGQAISQYVNPMLLDDSLADHPSITLHFFARPTNNQNLRIQNHVFVFRTNPAANNPLHVKIGATIAQTMENLATALRNYPSSDMQEATYTAHGDDLIITSKSRGALAKDFTIDEQGSSSRTRFTAIGGDNVYPGGDGRW